MSSARRICLITTGGTIGEGADGHEAGRRHVSGGDLLRRAGAADDVEVIDLFDLPSTFIGLVEMKDIAEAAFGALDAGAAGIVITHGTDTLEETAFFIDLMHDREQPIVVTGAMLPDGVAGADGAANLRNALHLARAPECAALGVLVTLAGEIHGANEVTKLHSTHLAAFKSLEFGPLGAIEEDRIYLARRSRRAPALPRPERPTSVEGIKCYAGMGDLLIRAAVRAAVDGIVLETLGSGQVPPQTMPVIREAVSAGIVVVAVPRSPMGRLIRDHYGLSTRVEGDERDLLEAGVIFSSLQGTKARIKLAVALGGGFTGRALRGLFEHTSESPAVPA